MDRRARGHYAARRDLAVHRHRRPAMPEYRAPGVYIEEVPSGVHSITGVSTSTAAFVGATASGPTNAPVLVKSFAEFQAQLGGLAADMPLGYAVQQDFGNGGREAVRACG